MFNAYVYLRLKLNKLIKGKKSLHNTDSNVARKNVSDIRFFGNADTFKLICKASSEKEGWMKSTKAMEIFGLGCVIQVTTQQGNNISEALVYVPNTKIEVLLSAGIVVRREIVSIKK